MSKGTEKIVEEREAALCEMQKAALKLIKLIEREKDGGSGGDSWHSVEVALLDIREAWEEAKACEILASLAPQP